MDELLVRIEDECRWTSGNWPHGSLAEDAVTAHVPAGLFRDVWAVAQNGDKENRQRSLAMAICITSALLRPLEAADTNVKTVLGHDKFQRLVDEARAELSCARAMRSVDDEFQYHIMDEVKSGVKPEEGGLRTTSSRSSGEKARGRRLGHGVERNKRAVRPVSSSLVTPGAVAFAEYLARDGWGVEKMLYLTHIYRNYKGDMDGFSKPSTFIRSLEECSSFVFYISEGEPSVKLARPGDAPDVYPRVTLMPTRLPLPERWLLRSI